MVQLLNIDCLEYMKTQPDKSFDLAVVDPPYGIGMGSTHFETKSSKTNAKDYGYKDWDIKPTQTYFKSLFRVSRNQIIFGANHFISLIAIDSPCWIVWEKNNGDSIHADCELAWTSFKTAVRKFNFTWHGMRQGDMRNKEIRVHPTQKPVALYNWIFENYATPGQRVLDTHLGSGSSAISAMNYGLDFVGCEIDHE